MNFLLIPIGILVGLIAGLFPGLHINFILSILAVIGLNKSDFSLFAISLFPSYLISSLLPSIFFAAPEAGNVTIMLPGQRLLKEGKGLLALKAAIFSIVIAALVCVVIFPLTMDFYSRTFLIIKDYLKFLLLVFSILLLARSKNPINYLVFFISSGILGYCAFNIGLKEPFLPLFCGMFAISGLIDYSKAKHFPYQSDSKIPEVSLIKYSVLGVVLGLIADFFPGISSSSQIATFLSIFIPLNSLSYLSTTSAVTISQSVFSLSTAAAIDKSRVGATAYLSQFININDNLLLLLSVFIFSLSIAALIVYLLRNKISFLATIDFGIIRYVLIAYFVVVTLILNGFFGIVILCFSTILGLLCMRFENERTSLMGSIIIPTLMLLFRIFF
jgi:putative membrane protein